MSDEYLKNNIEYLNMMFEVSTIANQTDDIYELLKKLKDYILNLTKTNDINFYLLEHQVYKCVVAGNSSRASEYFECEEGNSPFWDAVSKAKITSMKGDDNTPLFKSFLEYNNIAALNPTHVRVFFNNGAPICFCFIKEDEKNPITSGLVKNLIILNQ